NDDFAKSRFIPAASHDLRHPMHALGLFIAELSTHPHPPAIERLVRQIAASAESMGNLLDSLLDVSRLDAGALEPNIRPCPLQPIFERTARDFQITAEERGLTLRVRPTEAWVVTDPLLLERILSNLVSNAIRYTPAGRIVLAARRSGEALRIEVRDSGIGIPPAAQELIFEEFVQLHNPERARTKGLGLGLSIVRRLTLLLGHPLSLRSQPDAGTVFGITVERSAPVDASTDDTDERPPGSLKNVRVALVDNDPLARDGLASLLAAWGCEVRAADSLNALLSMLEHAPPPDVLITDFRLPGHGSGLDVVNEVQLVCGYRLRSILISADTSNDTRALARSVGLPLLHKPVRPAKLRALMQRMLAASSEDDDTDDPL
ncbi:MAG: hybrid sensor histidine kinase/response regulator, partial [Rhodocyclaceae bacterium]|nr:hybrid sensor histidine kinase/response regulator [Rhodocyclaceae bacterium]